MTFFNSVFTLQIIFWTVRVYYLLKTGAREICCFTQLSLEKQYYAENDTSHLWLHSQTLPGQPVIVELCFEIVMVRKCRHPGSNSMRLEGELLSYYPLFAWTQ